MIIRNPTLGAGNGKIGGLVGWQKGNAQVLRQNVRPVKSMNARSVSARSLMREVSSFWKSISKAQKQILAAYAASVSTKNSFQYFNPCINRALFANMGVHFPIESFLEANFNQISWASPFYSGKPAVVDWQLIDNQSEAMTLTISDAYFDQDFGRLHIYFLNATGGGAWFKLQNASQQFGLQLTLTFHMKRRKSSIRLFVSNASEFDAPRPYQEMVIEDCASIFASTSFDYTCATEVDIVAFAVTAGAFYESNEIGRFTFSI